MKSFAFYAVALVALTAFAAQARAQVGSQTLGFIKITPTNNVITLAQLNAAVGKYANYTSITAASTGFKNKNMASAPTVTVNTTANTITVTFPNSRGGFAFITVSGAGSLTNWGTMNKLFSRNATTGIISGPVKVWSQKPAKGPKADEEDVVGQTFLYKVSTAAATNITVTVAQMNASPIKAWALQSVTAVTKVSPNAAAAAVNNGTAIAITGVPANTKFLTVKFNGVVNMNKWDKWNKQNKTMGATPVNKSHLILKVTLTN